MKKTFFLIANLFVVVMMLTGCSRTTTEVWDDTRTAGHYMGKGFRSLIGKTGESRQVASQSEFAATATDEDFIPLQDEELYRQLTMGDMSALQGIDADSTIRSSKESPGDPGSGLPGIDGFTDPSTSAELSRVFQHIRFPYNSNLVKGRENLDIIKEIAAYMKTHRDTYIFVEGHCDERGTAAYNLSLGSKRANSVRNLLIKEGVDLDHLLTISYGKEKPFAVQHDENAWTQNRRAQFRIHRG